MLPKFALVCITAVVAATALAGSASADPEDAALATITPAAIRANMRFLSDDLLEGRGTGSRGYLLAAHYMAARFEAMGLQPGGTAGTYFQQVPIRSLFTDYDASSGSLEARGRSSDLVGREDYLLSPNPGEHDVVIDAPVVFVGYGVTAPSQHYDDYAHIDVKGKIVATLYGAPDFPTAIKAYYSDSDVKRDGAAEHGAVGFITIDDPDLEKLYSFEEGVRDLKIASVSSLDPAGKARNHQAGLKVLAYLSMRGTQKLFAGSGHTPDSVYAAAKRHKMSSFPLARTARFRTVSTSSDLQVPNVIGRLEGSDPALKSQYIVYSAHLDHLGVSTPVEGDAIYNGALDNASGSSILLEIAGAYARMPVKPKRSLLFIAVMGEEAGLIGSDYFATYPTVPAEGIVADINTDEDVMLWPLQDVVAYGAEHSSLESVVERAARKLGLATSPDPRPEEVYFIRSDQYSFVLRGVPSMFLFAGTRSDDPAIDPNALMEHWEATRYHHPDDDMQQPGLDFGAAQRYAQMAFLCGLYAADDAAAPAWKPGDFFGSSVFRH